MPNLYENIQRDLRNHSTELWVMSQDTDYYEEPNWYEVPNAYHESPLAREERQKQQASALQMGNHIAAMEKEKEKRLEILAAWEKQKKEVGKKPKMAKKKTMVDKKVDKTKVSKIVYNTKEIKKSQKQLAERVQQGLVKAVDTAKTRDQHHRELAGIPKPVVVKQEGRGKEQEEGKSNGRDDDDDDEFLTPEEEVEYLMVASMALVASTQNQMLMMASMDDDWVDDLALVVALQFAGVLDR